MSRFSVELDSTFRFLGGTTGSYVLIPIHVVGLEILVKLVFHIGLLQYFIKDIRFYDQVMEQCVARLDVAMFNAILRESANEIPTDPVSDPIVDSKVLPIPAGDLSFGSGAQLKNSVSTISSCYVLVD